MFKHSVRIFFIAFFCLFWSTNLSLLQAQQNDIVVTAGFQKREVNLGEHFQMMMRVKGDFDRVEKPIFPAVDSLQVRFIDQSSKFEYNQALKKYERIVEYTFHLIPERVGIFIVGPLQVTVDKRVFQTSQMEVRALPGVPNALKASQQSVTPQSSSQQQTQQPPIQKTTPSQNPSFFPSSIPQGSQTTYGNYKGADQNIFLKVIPDKRTVYPGEQVNLTYSLYTRVETRYEGFDQEPDTKGFWIEEMIETEEIGQKTVYLNGKRYMQADIRQIALFPTTPGEYQIDPGVIRATVQTASNMPDSQFFGSFYQDRYMAASLVSKKEDRRLGGEMVPLTVKPYPDQRKPQKFQGMTGDYQISATIDKQKGELNEPIEVSVFIQGEGNIEAIAKPYFLKTDDFRIVESEPEKNIIKRDGKVRGGKKFRFVFLPRESGKLSVGPFYVIFFDPLKEAYVTRESESFTVDVVADDSEAMVSPVEADNNLPKETVQNVSNDIFYIKSKVSNQAYNRQLADLTKIFIGVSGFLFLWLIGLIFFRYQEIQRDKNRPGWRKRMAFLKFEKDLKKLKKKMRLKADKKEGFSELSLLMRTYFAEKLGKDVNGMTVSQVKQLINSYQFEPEVLENVSKILDVCDYTSFANTDMDQVNLKVYIKESLYWLATIEKAGVIR